MTCFKISKPGFVQNLQRLVIFGEKSEKIRYFRKNEFCFSAQLNIEFTVMRDKIFQVWYYVKIKNPLPVPATSRMRRR